MLEHIIVIQSTPFRFLFINLLVYVYIVRVSGKLACERIRGQRTVDLQTQDNLRLNRICIKQKKKKRRVPCRI